MYIVPCNKPKFMEPKFALDPLSQLVVSITSWKLNTVYIVKRTLC